MDVLISAERLLLRIRQVPSRADELLVLRRRVRAEHAVVPDAAERETALAIRALKVEISAALAGVDACRSCSTGKPWPRGAYAGGDCCSGVTADVFDDDEVAALAQAGTRPRDLNAPRGEHPGCAFRGPHGCTLEAADRPGLCVHYVCETLRGELHDRDDLVPIEARLAELDRQMIQFVALRADRLERAQVAELEAALTAQR